MPTIDIPDKICPHCGGITYKVQYQGKYTSHRCIVLDKETKKQYREANQEKLKELSKLNYYGSSRYEKTQRRRSEFLSKTHSTCSICKKTKHVSKFKKASKYSLDKRCISCINKSRCNRSMKELRDTYVKMCIVQDTVLKHDDIPQWLIETKREQLLLTRQLKNNGKNN
jgi:hypothetical protein